jgi:hypothetical protein
VTGRAAGGAGGAIEATGAFCCGCAGAGGRGTCKGGAIAAGLAGSTGAGGGAVYVGLGADEGTTTLGAGGTDVGGLGGTATGGFIAGRLTTGAGLLSTIGGTIEGRGGGATGVGGAAGGCCLLMIALSTSPGLEMCERSILVLISSGSIRPKRGARAEAEGSLRRKCARTFSASCSSRELEWVFFSVTPASGSTSRMALLLTSSSLARSLIRILLIRPLFPPNCPAKSSCQPHGVSFSSACSKLFEAALLCQDLCPPWSSDGAGPFSAAVSDRTCISSLDSSAEGSTASLLSGATPTGDSCSAVG